MNNKPTRNWQQIPFDQWLEAITPREQWESEICDALELKADLTTSDAQGLMEANPFYIAQSWAKGLTATQTADVILNAGI